MQTVGLQGLWIDLSASVQRAELPRSFRLLGSYRRYEDPNRAAKAATEHPVDFALFEVDFPSSSDLGDILEFKRSLPSLPTILLTVQHSESLAVWALRSRIFDYFVSPPTELEVTQCMRGLLEIRQLQQTQEPRALLSQESTPPIEYGTRGVEAQLSKAIMLVERKYYTPLANEVVAEACGLNQFRFSKLFKEVYGVGFHEYLTRYRLREARRLLCNTKTNVTEVCFAVGFNDPSYFTRVFRKYFDLSPSNLLGVPLSDDNGPHPNIPLLPPHQLSK